MSLHVLEFYTESLSSSYAVTEFDVILTVYQSSGIWTKRQLSRGFVFHLNFNSNCAQEKQTSIFKCLGIWKWISRGHHKKQKCLFFTEHSSWDFVLSRSFYLVPLVYFCNVHNVNIVRRTAGKENSRWWISMFILQQTWLSHLLKRNQHQHRRDKKFLHENTRRWVFSHIFVRIFSSGFVGDNKLYEGSYNRFARVNIT